MGNKLGLSLTVSTLLMASTTGFLASLIRSRIRRSSVAIFTARELSGGVTTSNAASTSSAAPTASSTMKRPSALRAECRPGVSTNTIWPAGPFQTPRIRLRVVWGFLLTIASLWPTI